MGKTELGQKMTCADCAARFYDLNRTPILCPKCGVEQRAARPGSPYPGRSSTRRWLPRTATFVHIEPDAAAAAAAGDGVDVGDALDSADPAEEDDADVVENAVDDSDDDAGDDGAGDEDAGDEDMGRSKSGEDG